MKPASQGRPPSSSSTSKGRGTSRTLIVIGVCILALSVYQFIFAVHHEIEINNSNAGIPVPATAATTTVSRDASEQVKTASNLPARNYDGNTTFSSCLLVMDDNHFLIEWLAYHFHSLPLRYLIIAVDSRSRTSPSLILDRWRDNITIVQWNDADFLPPEWQPQNRPINEDDAKDKFIRHRERQRHFYPACLQALKQAGRSWTTVIDIDEYLQLNPHYSMPDGGIQQAHETHKHQTVLNAIWSHAELYNNTTTKCIMMPRLRFGNYEDEDSQVVVKDLPAGYDPKAFQTLRWRWRADLHNRKLNRNPKSMVNVQQIHNFSREDTDAHRPVRSACPQQGLYVQNKDSPFVVHHYVGTWEQYSFRKDARDGLKQRNTKRFSEYGTVHEGIDDTICHWLDQFVHEVGERTAASLLAGVGDVSYSEATHG